MNDETPIHRAPDISGQLAAFNEVRRALLANKPIDPEGEFELMSDAEKRRIMGLEETA